MKAAQTFQAWIFVRITNHHAPQYFGKAIYSPKPIDIKAKTANRPVNQPGKMIAGLVADPRRWPKAFKNPRNAESLWDSFCADQGLGKFLDEHTFEGKKTGNSGYSIDVEPGSKHEGCVVKSGMYLFGDYDLFDIVFVGEETQTSPTKLPSNGLLDVRGARWQSVADFLNGQFGGRRPMIQHGQHFFFRPDGEEDADFQKVYAFPPRGRFEIWHATKLSALYRQWGRQYSPRSQS